MNWITGILKLRLVGENAKVDVMTIINREILSKYYTRARLYIIFYKSSGEISSFIASAKIGGDGLVHQVHGPCVESRKIIRYSGIVESHSKLQAGSIWRVSQTNNHKTGKIDF